MPLSAKDMRTLHKYKKKAYASILSKNNGFVNSALWRGDSKNSGEGQKICSLNFGIKRTWVMEDVK